MRNYIVLGLVWMAALWVTGCGSVLTPQPSPSPSKLSYDFRQGTQGWQAGFSVAADRYGFGL